MINNQKELTLNDISVNMKDLTTTVDTLAVTVNDIALTLGGIVSRFENVEVAIVASEERMKTYIQTYVEKEFDDFAIIINKSFMGLEERMDRRFGKIESRLDKVEISIGKIESRLDKVEISIGKIESRLDKIELSTPRELEKRITIVEEDSDLHDSYFRGFKKTLQVV